jgi:tetratricopeptide (TPR) repeat protein
MYNMRKYLPHILIISFVFLLTPTVSFADAEANRIFKLNSKAVVMVTSYDEQGNAIAQGSGFIVKRDGVVVTNYHVIGMASDIKVKAGNKIFDVEGLIFTDKINDLAILKARAKDMPVVKLGVIGEANIGEHVYVIGYPIGLGNTISVGLLSGIRKIDEKREILRTTIPVSPGSSGGPVFSRNGEVIGVVTTGYSGEVRNSSLTSLAISVKLIKDKISSKSITAIKESGLEDYMNTAMYWNTLGSTYYKSGKYEEAIESYKQAIRIDPDYAMAHYNLGLAYVESGKYKEAIESYKQALRIDPDSAIAHYNLGVAYGESGKYKEAIESYKQVVRIDPDYADAHCNLGVAYYESGMNKEAIEAFKQVVRIDPDDAEVHYCLGVAYGESGKYKEAIESYKQVVRIDPDYADAHCNLGLAYYESGMYKEAMKSFKQVVRIDPDDAEVHFNLGLTYLQLNDRGSALEQYEILKSLESGLANELFNAIYE